MVSIVIPDVHQNIKQVEKILSSVHNYDEVIFLGDWFDSHYEPPQVAGFGETCEYLKHLVLDHKDKDKFVFLVGNHDINYIHQNKRSSHESVHSDSAYYASGFTKNKAKTFRKCFFDSGLRDDFFVKNFKIAYRSQNITFSHAGILEQHIPYNKSIDYFVSEVLPDAWRNFRDLSHKYNYTISDVGYCRGGNASVGGVLWLDWYNEFVPSENVGRQIIGHSHSMSPQWLHADKPDESWNIDADNTIAIIDNDTIKVTQI